MKSLQWSLMRPASHICTSAAHNQRSIVHLCHAGYASRSAHVVRCHLRRDGWHSRSCRPPQADLLRRAASSRAHASVAAARSPASTSTAGWDPDREWLTEQQDIGPAFAASLDLLNWKQLCRILSNHASTAVGKRMCQELLVPEAQVVSEQLLMETRCDSRAHCSCSSLRRCLRMYLLLAASQKHVQHSLCSCPARQAVPSLVHPSRRQLQARCGAAHSTARYQLCFVCCP
jgi:hypothetical protein